MGQKASADACCKNETWARLAEVSLPLLNRMERELLSMLRYDLSVDALEFREWSELLAKGPPPRLRSRSCKFPLTAASF